MLPPCWFWRRAQGYPLLHFDLVWDRCCVFPAAKCFWETLTILSHCWYFSTTFAFMSLGFHVNAVQWIEGLLTTSNFAHLGELSELHSLPSENKKRAFCEKRQNGANCVVRPFAKLAYFTAYICDRRAYIPKCSAHKDGYHFVPLNNHQPPHPIHHPHLFRVSLLHQCLPRDRVWGRTMAIAKQTPIHRGILCQRWVPPFFNASLRN